MLRSRRLSNASSVAVTGAATQQAAPEMEGRVPPAVIDGKTSAKSAWEWGLGWAPLLRREHWRNVLGHARWRLMQGAIQ